MARKVYFENIRIWNGSVHGQLIDADTGVLYLSARMGILAEDIEDNGLSLVGKPVLILNP
jgi:hypothetical protein